MKIIKKLLAGLAMLLLLAFPFLVYFNAQALTDWVQLRNYTPPANVVSLAKQDGMTAYAKHVFYVNHPQIESNTSQFQKDCGQTEKTIILGCYHSNQDGIFVYNVTDQRLDGIQQVTSAHEMLHAAYDRLSGKDKKQVNMMLQDYFNNGLSDQRIKDTINSYKQTEPDDLVNEMHSIFGTEVANLPAPLEKYYKKYFINRSVVTKDAASYENEFTSREDQIKAYDAKLDILKSQLNSQQQSLKAQYNQIITDKARLESLKSSGQIAQYNNGVDSYNAEVRIYNAAAVKMRADIAAYNLLIDQRNAIASELASLDKSIDTRQVPATVQ